MKTLSKRTIISLRFLLLTLFATAGATSSYADTTRESVYERVMRTGEIRCGYALWPGLVEKDANTGKLDGAFFDYVEALGKSLQLKIVWLKEIEFGTLVEELQTDKVDAICSGAWTNPIRGKFVEFTTPIAYQPTLPYVRVGDSRFDRDLEKLNQPNIVISIVDGESAQTIAESDFPQAKTLSMPSGTAMSQMLLNVVHGKADVTFTDPGLAGEFMAHNPGKIAPVKSQFPLRVFGTPISLKKGELALKETLDNATRQLLTTGAIEKILKRHERYPQMYLRVKLPFDY